MLKYDAQDEFYICGRDTVCYWVNVRIWDLAPWHGCVVGSVVTVGSILIKASGLFGTGRINKHRRFRNKAVALRSAHCCLHIIEFFLHPENV